MTARFVPKEESESRKVVAYVLLIAIPRLGLAEDIGWLREMKQDGSRSFLLRRDNSSIRDAQARQIGTERTQRFQWSQQGGARARSGGGGGRRRSQ